MAPDALTLARPVLGAAAGVAVASGDGGLGGWLYLAGYLTDVFDGLLARALHVSSPHGERLDGICDLIAMYCIGLGLLVRAVLDGAWAIAVVIVAASIASHIADRYWVPAHTVVGKALGGLTRVGTLVLFIYFAAPGQRLLLTLAGVATIVITFSYEAIVTLHELRSGERPVH